MFESNWRWHGKEAFSLFIFHCFGFVYFFSTAWVPPSYQRLQIGSFNSVTAVKTEDNIAIYHLFVSLSSLCCDYVDDDSTVRIDAIFIKPVCNAVILLCKWFKMEKHCSISFNLLSISTVNKWKEIYVLFVFFPLQSFSFPSVFQWFIFSFFLSFCF